MEIKILVPNDIYIFAQERAVSLGYKSVSDYVRTLVLLDRDHTCFPDVENKIFDRFISAMEREHTKNRFNF